MTHYVGNHIMLDGGRAEKRDNKKAAPEKRDDQKDVKSSSYQTEKRKEAPEQ